MMASWFKVTATALNLRSRPVVKPSTRLATLNQGQLVRQLGGSTTPGWIEVEAKVGATVFKGFVSKAHLTPAPAPAPPPVPAALAAVIPAAVHLTPPKGVRTAQIAMASGLKAATGMPLPRKPSDTSAKKVVALHAAIAWLDSPTGGRYAPGAGKTYCNIYAYDYANLAGVYLPRVWWMDKALLAIARGETPEVAYGETVREMNANSLYDWLAHWGDDYGWRRLTTPDEAQAAANAGEAVLICAKRKDLSRSGHITAVAPEPGAPVGMTATRVGGKVTRPLLSQAGSVNFRYRANSFYLGDQFQAFGFWAHA